MTDFTDALASSRDPGFRDQVHGAMFTVASLVAGEAQGSFTTIQWRKRNALASNILRDERASDLTSSWLDVFAIGVPSSNSTIRTGADDNDVQFQVQSMWDDYSGVTGEDLGMKALALAQAKAI